MKSLMTCALIALSACAFAQTTDIATSDTSKWKKGGVASLNVSQSSFTNWAAGGENNINIASVISLYANRRTQVDNWENNLDLGYGVQRLSDGPYRKSDDRIELNSKYGIKMTEKINYSFLLNFRSQFADGYNYTDTSTVFVSTFLSPSFTTISGGLDYKPTEDLSIFVSPITGKITTVLDDRLAAKGAYGVDTGKNVRFEVGALLSVKYQKNLAENILIKSKLDLFGNYENFQAIDINWENLVSFQITRLLAATLSTNLLYDQDILIPKQKETSPGVYVVENSPRVQFKQVFALGVTYKF